MNRSHSTLQFAGLHSPGFKSHDCELTIVQQPRTCKVAVGKEKDRKPVDPPPIIQLRINPQSDPYQSFLHSHSFFLTCSVVTSTQHNGPVLAGTNVSSLHRLKGPEGEGAFFVFGDISIKIEGDIRLQFDLFELRDGICTHISNILSEEFPVVSQKAWPGMAQSTQLTRSFSEQGCRLRLRKEPKSMLRLGGPSGDDYQPRHYQKTRSGRPQQVDRMDATRVLDINEDDAGAVYQQHVHTSHTPALKQLSRSYSNRTVESPENPQIFEQPMVKRPRTGSEHNQMQSFGHQAFPDDPSQYHGEAIYSGSHVPNFASLQPQASQIYGYNYAAPIQDMPGDSQFTGTHLNQTRQSSISHSEHQISLQGFQPHISDTRTHHGAVYYDSSPTRYTVSRPQLEYTPTSFSMRQQQMTIPQPSDDWSKVGSQVAYQQHMSVPVTNVSQGYSPYMSTNPTVSTSSGMLSYQPITSGPEEGGLY